MKREPDIDLGDDHRLWFYGWGSDRDLNPKYADIPDTDRYGASIEHRKPDGTLHSGGVTFDTEIVRAVMALNPDSPGRAVWQVESWDPLTISPSVLCECGDHGFIRGGKWVRA